jgi:hypothetical protein
MGQTFMLIWRKWEDNRCESKWVFCVAIDAATLGMIGRFALVGTK